MHETFPSIIEDMAGTASSGQLPGGVVSVLMHPMVDGMNPLCGALNREHREDMPTEFNASREMISALHQVPDMTAHVDMGGKDTRPADLSAQFDPKMDQDVNLYTGGGDDMVIIV